MRTECDRGFMSMTRGFLGYPSIGVYSATPLAAAHGLLGDGEPLSPADRARALARPSAAHDLAVQAYVASLTGARPPIAMEIEGIQHQPDAITETLSCYEIELNQKSDSRIYRSYLFYAHAIGAGQIRDVRYVFRSDLIADAYRRRFAETEWPDVVYSADRRRYVTREPFTVDPEHPVRASFSFVVESHLWPFPQS